MKTHVQFLLSLIVSLMVFGCFAQSSLEVYEQKKEAFTETILKHKWSEPNKIKSIVEPVIVMRTGRNQKIGASKFGGTPDLPEGTEWPKSEGHSMVFFAQLNLNDIANFDQENLLPKTGFLYFFSYFEAPEGDYGAEYEYKKENADYKVLYLDKPLIDLKATKFPKDLVKVYQFKPSPIDFELIFQIPPTIECSAYDVADLNSDDAAIYDQLISDYDNYECEEQMILGTPCPMQYGADFDWALSYLDITDFQDPIQREKVENIRPEFINLFSFPMYDIFEKIGYSNCYFGITKEDLKNKDFDKTVFIMQGT
ncbi:DUF1963 domain-containing protein [Psychroserpens luteus]|uniref:DUF1963 domain-containing protein n=1 Tax=Psychroserpens luteus TaxID=1434066 RepID=A0ABW5ZWH5_9FLAO|nr:YwqG family protein [Psychroserpens luteus]